MTMEWATYALAYLFLSIFFGLLLGAFIAAGKGDDDSTYGAPEGGWRGE